MTDKGKFETVVVSDEVTLRTVLVEWGMAEDKISRILMDYRADKEIKYA